MALEKQTLPISLSQGLDQKDDPKQIPAGKLTSLQNAIFQTGGELRKRNGYTALTKSISGGGTISTGVLMADYAEELVELDGQNLYSYNSGGPNWINKGTLATTALVTKTVIRNTTQQTLQDSAINGNYQCFVWYDSVGQIGYSVFDIGTNQSVVNNGVVDASGTHAKVLALGTNFVIVYYSSTGPALKYKTISTATPTAISSATTISTDINSTNKLFDVTAFNSRLYIAFSSQSTTAAILYYLDSSLVLSSLQSVGATRPTASLNIVGDTSNQPWVSWCDGTNIKVTVRSANLSSQVLAPTTLEAQTAATNITAIVSGTTGTFYYQVTGTTTVTGDPNDFIKTNTMTVGGSAGPASVFNRGVGLASKVFSYQSVNYFLAAYQSNLQSSYFLFNGSGTIVLKLSPAVGGGYTTRSILPEVNTVSTGVFQTASLIKDLLVSNGGNVFTQTGVLSAQMSFVSGNVSKFTLGSNLHIAGGILNMYDGASVVEHGYNVYPEGLTGSVSTAASSTPGNLLNTAFGVGSASYSSTQDLQYSAVYEWTDNEGQLHRSSPSVPITLRASSFGQVTTFSGTNGTPGASSLVINSATPTTNLAVGQYVFSRAFFNYLNPNARIGTISGSTITINQTNIGTAFAGAVATYTVSNNPIAWIQINQAGTNYAVGSYTLTSSGTNTYGNLAVGQVLQGGENASDGAAEHLSAGTYITAISGTAGGVVTITLSEPLLFAYSGTSYTGLFVTFFSFDTAQATVTVPTLRLTSKPKVSLALYRTELNGTVFYRVNSPTSLTYNDKTVDSVTITDTVADDVLVGNEQLYTTGEIENIEVPAVNLATTFKSRSIAIPSENPLSWWYSKKVIPGAPVEFSDSFVNNIDSRIGTITAAGVLDEKIIFFGPGSKYFVVGDGPSASGANNDFSEPQHITGSTGCSNQASVLEIPVGLLYQDPTKGIYLLDRSLQEQYIGSSVADYNADPITSAQTIPGTTSVRFTLTSGAVLTYDWFYGQWGSDPYVAEAISSCLSDNLFTYVQGNGLVLQEASGTFSDNGTFVPLALTTGWMSFAGVQGFQRVYELVILGEYKSPHDLVVNIYSDYGTAATQTVTIPVQSNPGNYEFRIRIVKQKCTSIKIAITDSQSSNFGQGLSLSNLAFVVGIKKGLNKLPAAQSY